MSTTPGTPPPPADGPDPQHAPTAPVGPPPGAYPPGGGPPPGYGAPGAPGAPGGPPPGQWPAAPAPAPTSGGGSSVGGPAMLSIVSIACLAAAVSISEDGDNGWGRIGVWAAFAIAAAVATAAPSFGGSVGLSATRAWQVAVGGAASLVGFWVLFVLPSISMNVSFGATVGVAAGCLAVWLSGEKPAASPPGGTTW